MDSSNNSFFPIFLNLSQKSILIIGGGSIAKDKLEKLLDFTKNIKLISKEFSKDILLLIKKNRLSYETREYLENDLDEFDLVVVAINDIELQKKIFYNSKNKKILVNTVDNKNYCDFIFGSYIKEGDLTISISTSGVSPAFTKQLKIYLKKSLPPNLSKFLRNMKDLRQTLPKGKERMKLFEKKTKEFFSNYK